jgi:protein-S-isoprenylcysteine O-methyltransferase Ste14
VRRAVGEVSSDQHVHERGGALRAGLLLSALAYGFGIAHDLASVRALPRVKPYLFGAMVAAHGASVSRLMRGSPRLPVPGILARLAALLSVLSFAGMCYSLLVEIPLRKAWLRRGHTEALVTTGTYALVRHPGVLWLAAGLGFGALATRSRRLLAAWPVIIAGDAFHVWFQERAVLPRVFGEAYREYQRTTPFLVPTRRSIRRVTRAVRERVDRLFEGAAAGRQRWPR